MGLLMCFLTFKCFFFSGVLKKIYNRGFVKRVLMCRLMTADQIKKALCLARRKAQWTH